MDLIHSCFWKRVLQVWINYTGVDEENTDVYLSEPIFNNNKIRFKGKTLFIKSFINRNILYIQDLYEDYNILGLSKFKEIYGSYNGIELDYNVVINAIVHKHVQFTNNRPKREQFENLTRREIYDKIKPKGGIEHVKNFWERKGCLMEGNYWEIPIQCTGEVRLRLLQWKIIHNIYPTNILLYKMKIAASVLCESCQVTDYTEKFFFHCNTVKKIWQAIENSIQSSTGISIKLGVKEVMLGILQLPGVGKTDVLRINYLILIGKMVISKIKYGPKKYYLEVLESELRIRKVL